MKTIVVAETCTGELLELQYELSTRQYLINGAVVTLLPLRQALGEYLFERRGPLFPGLYHISAAAVQVLLKRIE